MSNLGGALLIWLMLAVFIIGLVLTMNKYDECQAKGATMVRTPLSLWWVCAREAQ